jgi:hypothetical protein
MVKLYLSEPQNPRKLEPHNMPNEHYFQLYDGENKLHVHLVSE